VAKEVWQEEAEEDGVAIGREEVFSLLESGMSLAEAKKSLNLKKS